MFSPIEWLNNSWFRKHLYLTELLIWVSGILGFIIVAYIPPHYQDYLGLIWLVTWGLIVTTVDTWIINVIKERGSKPPWFLRSLSYFLGDIWFGVWYKYWIGTMLFLILVLFILMLLDIFSGGRISVLYR